MPLIILTGFPTSGKTYRAQQLQSYLSNHIATFPSTSLSSTLRVHLISDHTLLIPRSVYNLECKGSHERSNNSSEKDARATIYGAVKRVLSTKDIVILDGANYIKGWRYQLYCEAKAVRTTCCVVHVGTSVEDARKVNEERSSKETISQVDPRNGERSTEEKIQLEMKQPYDPLCWENLIFRYEEPNAATRWDSPLFTVLWNDETPPYSTIWDALIGSDAEGGRKVVRPNQATVLKAPSNEGFLYELDRSTQAILNKILEWTKEHPGEGGGDVSVGDTAVIGAGQREDLVVELPVSQVGLPGLQRLRRQFIALNRTNNVPVKRIRESFVAYLNDSFGAL